MSGMPCCKNDGQHRGSGCHHRLKKGNRATAYAAQIRLKEKGVIVHTGRQIFMRKALGREWPKRRGRSCGMPVQYECCAKITVREGAASEICGVISPTFHSKLQAGYRRPRIR
ncbi:hypothetical protein CT3_19910 [Comamonas terrigena NBRC 13299]|nr:hypothetical protein CT3_19910 [Comamonas terrigena NBRC 13299]